MKYWYFGTVLLAGIAFVAGMEGERFNWLGGGAAGAWSGTIVSLEGSNLEVRDDTGNLQTIEISSTTMIVEQPAPVQVGTDGLVPGAEVLILKGGSVERIQITPPAQP